jgi:hypothetical protein
MNEPTTATLEVVADSPAELVAVLRDSGLEPVSAQSLLLAFKPSFLAATKLIEDAKAVVVTDATMVTEIKRARELRLSLRKVRVDAEKLKEKLKENSLREGRAIQGVWNLVKLHIEPVEQRLQEAEDFAVRAEADRKAKIKADRDALVKPYADPTFYQLGDMPEDAFQKLLHGLKAAAQAVIDAAEKARVEKEAKDKAEAAERERVRLENERLRAEAAEKEAALKIEREKAAAAAELARREKEASDAAAAKAKADAEAELAKAREAATKEAARLKAEADAKLAEERKLAEQAAAKLKAEADAETARLKEIARLADLKAKADAAKAKALADEAQLVVLAQAALDRQAREQFEADAKAREASRLAAIAAEQAAAAKAEKAPEKEKLIAFAMQIRALQVPELSTDAGRAVATVVKTYQEKLAVFVEDKAAAL